MKNNIQIPGTNRCLQLDYNAITNKVVLKENGVVLQQEKKQKGKPFILKKGDLLYVKPSIFGVKGTYKGEKFDMVERLSPLDIIFGFIPLVNFLFFMGAIPGALIFLGVVINIGLLRSSLSQGVKYLTCLLVTGGIFGLIFLILGAIQGFF